MKYLHTMVRIGDLGKSLDFYVGALGLIEKRRMDNAAGRFTLIFLAAPESPDAEIELTHNWDESSYGGGRNFGHLAFAVDNVDDSCRRLMDQGVVITRPPRDGRMACVRSPDNISIELLQRGPALDPVEPWTSMPNVGSW
ncbi:MAG: VOC family protein [Alphaproteobacteria bacterium]